jgi:hypothetical protein
LKAGPVFIASEKIPPPRRPRIFNDHADEDVSQKRKGEDRWAKKLIDELAGVIRRIAK